MWLSPTVGQCRPKQPSCCRQLAHITLPPLHALRRTVWAQGARLCDLAGQPGHAGGPAARPARATAASAAAATADEARLAHAEALLATLQSEAGVLHAALAASKQALEHSRTAVTTDELRRCWLTIGIPSVPRHVQQQRLSPEAVSTVANTSYLTSTLTSLLHELPADPTGAPCLL